jgi:phage minor structural protein
MLLEVDINTRPDEIRLFLCKNDNSRTTIAELKEAFGRKIVYNYGGINQLSFKLPYKVMRNMEFIDNPNISLIRGDFLIRYEKGSTKIYFIISNPEKSSNDGKEEFSVECHEQQFEWKNKLIRNYKGTKLLYDSVGSNGVLNETLLTKTDWTINYSDSSLINKYRTIDESQRNLLEFVYDVVGRYGEYITIVDTVNKKASVYLEANLGTDEGLSIEHGKYLKSLTENENFENVVTRLYIYGKDDITIIDKNPSGSPYLEDLSFYMYPFARDASRNVLKSSNYMTDGLCHAILDYDALLLTKTNDFNSLLSQKSTKQSELTTKQNELTTLNTDKKLIEDRIDVQQATQTITNHFFTYNNSTTTKTATLVSTNKYAVMCKVSTTTNLTVTLDGVVKTLTANTWTVLGKIASVTSSNVVFSGTATNVDVKVTYVKITDSEYSTAGNESTIINTYCLNYKQSQIDAKNTEITTLNNDIAGIDSQIADLRNTLKIENNFTTDQIKERNRFIKESVWQDNNYTTSQDLYDEGVKRIKQVSQPIVSYKVSAIDFISALNTQNDWNRLKIGGIVTIKYPNFGIDIKAKIIAIEHDIDGNDLQLTISNVRDIKSGFLKLKDLLNKAVNTSTQIDMSKYKWDKSESNSTSIDQLINNAWDANARAIQGGTNENYTLDRRGLTLKDPSDPLNYLRAIHNIVAFTNDGGNSYKNSLTTQGCIKERIIIKLFSHKGDLC